MMSRSQQDQTRKFNILQSCVKIFRWDIGYQVDIIIVDISFFSKELSVATSITPCKRSLAIRGNNNKKVQSGSLLNHINHPKDEYHPSTFELTRATYHHRGAW